MIKAKFGDSLRSKTDTAMVNEALCKILCHNLCCLVQSAYELGITATFGARKRVLFPSQQKMFIQSKLGIGCNCSLVTPSMGVP